MEKKMLKKKVFWIGVLLALALAGAGYYLYATRFAAAAVPAETSALQTAVASQGDLVILASGSGSVVPARQVSLGFDESGTLIELLVQEGDTVRVGDVLARLQTKESAESLAAQVAEAELAVIKAQNALDDLYANAEIARTQALSDIAAYAQEVRDAQYQLENYTLPTFLQGMETVEAVDRMKAALDQAWRDFEPYRYFPQTDETRRRLLTALNLAQSNYDAAIKRLNYEYALQVAEANLAKARQEYEKYKDGPAADELAEAQATLENARANLALAQATQPILELVAPFDGVVLAVDASVGEALSGAFLSLADLSTPTLEVFLDETDLDKVAVGYPVEVVFDALPDRTFTGKVVRVSRSLQDVSNVQAIRALVQLDLESIDPPVDLPVGLNAAVDVIAGRATNAVLVPIEALRDLGGGEYGVFVVENGEPRLRVVEVGLMDLTTAEIKSGLQAGEIVSTGITQVK
jgi:multidrug efflux pump subunit AcrA (membrane-fusion protein)